MEYDSAEVNSENQTSITNHKTYIPPPLNLLPRPTIVANSLLPMLPLPDFTGQAPQVQPYCASAKKPYGQATVGSVKWIGQVFQTDIVYQKYPDCSYERIDNNDLCWNVWACDIRKLEGEKPDVKQHTEQLQPFYTPNNEQDKTLVFQSRFESGNLSLASKVNDNEYNLLLQNDINTTGYTQWFFFRVTNTHTNHRVKFNILNLYKGNSLFGSGMKIVVFSMRELDKSGKGWHRAGTNISYYQNGCTKDSRCGKRCYTFTWTYDFQHQDDEVYFAYNYPYTYSDLDRYLNSVCENKKIVKRSLLTKTLVGNRVDLLTITEEHPYKNIKKRYIVVGARVHPGQTVSSFMCRGIINFLISDCTVARKLRQTFIFKIVPMINPDGVIHGNYRSNITGADLNRRWADCTPWQHQEIFHFRKMIRSCEEDSRVEMFCDLHGHSIKKSIFMYGNHNSKRPFEGKQFPYILGKLSKSFAFKNCSFLSSDVREGSGRSTLSRELSCPTVYTLESSFCGPEDDNVHFSIDHLEQLGKSFCEALHIFYSQYIKQLYMQAEIHYNYIPAKEQSTEKTAEKVTICQELYKNRSSLNERVNSQNSQGTEPEVEEMNLLSQDAVRKFIQKSRKKSLTPVRKKEGETQLNAKSTANFIIHKSQPKIQNKKISELKNKRKKTQQSNEETDKQAIMRQLAKKSPFVDKRSPPRNLAYIPGTIYNLEFHNSNEEEEQTKIEVLEKEKRRSKLPIRYEYLMGFDLRATNNCVLNNFISSFPRKSTAKRSSSDVGANTHRQPSGSPESSRLSPLKNTDNQRLLVTPNILVRKPMKDPEPRGDYNTFKNVLQSLRKPK